MSTTFLQDDSRHIYRQVVLIFVYMSLLLLLLLIWLTRHNRCSSMVHTLVQWSTIHAHAPTIRHPLVMWLCLPRPEGNSKRCSYVASSCTWIYSCSCRWLSNANDVKWSQERRSHWNFRSWIRCKKRIEGNLLLQSVKKIQSVRQVGVQKEAYEK